MTRERNVLDRVADRIMDLDSPAYGDERERAVFMESSSFGLTTAIYVAMPAAVVAAAFGLVLLSVVLLALMLLQTGASLWYSRRRGVDITALAEHAGVRSTLVNILVSGATMVLTSAALSYLVFAGEPLLSRPSLTVTPGEGFWGGLVEGAVVGGMIGGLAAVIGGVHSFRRANRRRQDDDR